ncbi:unnamed protein product [Mytilus edulis]|uniref:TIR domain-containing protein n=1 Tax=Mytilus edulis TaxID=6550 RepID=A0A8S3RIJ8_MYTED|nr:unnamed protein product [Mytilus edulis]
MTIKVHRIKKKYDKTMTIGLTTDYMNYTEDSKYPLDSEEDYEYHAFVVYCDDVRKWVHNDLLNRLENEEGLQLCIHHRNFIVGDSISVNVDNFIKKSWKVLVIVSNNFAQSEWCQWEVDVVQERRRRHGKEVIVPIILDTIDSKHMTSQLRTLLDSTPSIRYRSGVGSELFWKVLLESLRKPLEHPPTSLIYYPSFNGQTRVSPETEPPTWLLKNYHHYFLTFCKTRKLCDGSCIYDILVMISLRRCVICVVGLIVIELAFVDLSNDPVECLKPFCLCHKQSRGSAVCSGRSLHYIPRLPKYVRSVTFTNTSISAIETFGLVNLTFNQMERIKFTGNLLLTIDKDAFLNLTFLDSLIISHEPRLDIFSLKSSFMSLTRLKILFFDFSFNSWKSLPKDIFNNYHFSNVKSLFLKSNSFNSVTFTTFETMTRLREIFLADNPISHISFTNLTSLTKLDMSSNLLQSVPTFCERNNTSYFPNLNILILSRTYIEFLDPKSFRCLPRLSTLYLDYTNIRKLQDNVFASLPSLRTLHLNSIGHPLETITQNAFNSSSLETLILRESHFHFDQKDRYNASRIFVSCPNLQYLDLTHNNMPSDESTFQTIFRPLKKLQTLFLTSTKIVSLPTNVFTHMKFLQKLHLDDNGISFWNNSYHIFGNMTSMKHLSLRQNYISVINETSFPEDLLSRLETLHLARNPFSCICDQMWFRNWIQKNGTILKEYPNGYRCRHPNSMNGILLRDYKPTYKMCNPWNPLYTMAIVMGIVVISFIAVGSIAAKCQGNIKNYIYLLRVYHNRKKGYIPLDSEEDYEYHAFVVYCDNDRKWVHNDLLNRLENDEGLQLCIHHRNFIVGDSISVNVDNFLKKSWKVLVIVSNNFAQSEWCQWEVDVVQERRRRQGKEVIVPIILDTIDSKHMTSQLRTLLDSTPSLRYRSGVGSELFWKVLLESLRKPLGHPPTSLLYYPSFNGQTSVSPETEPPTW